MTYLKSLEYRKKHNYWESFGIVLATFYEQVHAELIESPTHNPLEEKISMYTSFNMIASALGHRMFLPYKHVPENWDATKMIDIIHGVIIPDSCLVLCDTDVPSPVDPNKTSRFVTGIAKRAQELEIPVVHLHRLPSRVSEVPEKSSIDGHVKYSTNIDAFEGVRTIMKLTAY